MFWIKNFKKGKNIKCIRLIILILSILLFFYVIRDGITGFIIKKDIYGCPDCNVILIVLDDLRADHVGAYSYFRDTTPNIDKLAEESVIFENAITQATISKVSGASILTSTYPSTHRFAGPNNELPQDLFMISEELKKADYKTGAVMSNPGLLSEHGFSRGFDDYIETYKLEDNVEDSSNKNFIIDLSINWLEKNKDDKFFFFLWDMGPHESDDYPPPEPFNQFFDKKYHEKISEEEWKEKWKEKWKELSEEEWKEEGTYNLTILDEEFIQHAICHYDNKIRYTDEYIGKFIKTIKDFNLDKNTIIIIISDHGETLIDYKDLEQTGHGTLLNWEQTNVPLIIKFPNLIHKKIKTQVALIDLGPTILNILNIPLNKKIEGTSVLQTINKGIPRSNPFIFSEMNQFYHNFPTQKDIKSVRTDEWKYIITMDKNYDLYKDLSKMSYKEELFDLKNDPKELENVIDQYPKIATVLRNSIFEYIRSTDKSSIVYEDEIKIDQKIKEQLRSLGYLV